MTSATGSPPSFNDEERQALELVSKILTDIRFTCSGTADEITPNDVRFMHGLADAARNIPRVLAKRGADRQIYSFLIARGAQKAHDIYAEFGPREPDQAYQMVLYDEEVY